MGHGVLFHVSPTRWLDGRRTDQLVYPHMVDEELCGKDVRVDAPLSPPGATDGNVEDHVERLVKGPLAEIGVREQNFKVYGVRKVWHCPAALWNG